MKERLKNLLKLLKFVKFSSAMVPTNEPGKGEEKPAPVVLIDVVELVNAKKRQRKQ